MAVTGLILVAYLITHVLANLWSSRGPSRINALQPRCSTAPAARSGRARLVLLAALVLHVVAAVQLTVRQPRGAAGRRTPAGASRRSRPSPSRTIRWGGVLILVFLVFHILHFTIGTVHPDFVEGDPYHNVSDRIPQSRWWRRGLRGRDGRRSASTSITGSGAAAGAWASARRRPSRSAGGSPWCWRCSSGSGFTVIRDRGVRSG